MTPCAGECCPRWPERGDGAYDFACRALGSCYDDDEVSSSLAALRRWLEIPAEIERSGIELARWGWTIVESCFIDQPKLPECVRSWLWHWPSYHNLDEAMKRHVKLAARFVGRRNWLYIDTDRFDMLVEPSFFSPHTSPGVQIRLMWYQRRGNQAVCDPRPHSDMVNCEFIPDGYVPFSYRREVWEMEVQYLMVRATPGWHDGDDGIKDANERMIHCMRAHQRELTLAQPVLHIARDGRQRIEVFR